MVGFPVRCYHKEIQPKYPLWKQSVKVGPVESGSSAHPAMDQEANETPPKEPRMPYSGPAPAPVERGEELHSNKQADAEVNESRSDANIREIYGLFDLLTDKTRLHAPDQHILLE
jgi:hypothetical protein